MSVGKTQLVYRPDGFVDLLVRQGDATRTLTIDPFGAPMAPAAFGDPAVSLAVLSWGEAEWLPPWVLSWDDLRPALVHYGLDIEALLHAIPVDKWRSISRREQHKG